MAIESGLRVTAFCDGGSRGNPGPAGYGVLVQGEDGGTLAELSDYLGRKTNNVAEYSGLLAALEWAVAHGAAGLRVISDSELMVKQMKGQYRVNSPELRPLYEEAKRRAAQLGRFEMQHVLRGKNKDADRLANEAMDRGTGKGPAGRPGSAAGKSAPGMPAVAAAPAALAAGGRVAAGSPGSSASAQPAPLLAGEPRAAAVREPAGALPKEVTGFVRNGVVHLVEGELPEGTFVRILPGRQR